MKSSAIVICLFLGITQAVKYDVANVQLDSEALNRSNIRETLKSQLREALAKPEAPLEQSAIQLERCTYGDCDVGQFNHSYPAPIIPGSTIIPYPNPAASTNWDIGTKQNAYEMTMLQTDAEIHDDDDTVEGARRMAAQMQAQMDASVAAADQKRAEQQEQFEANVNKNDPAAQLQGLMNAQSSLKRMTSAFSAKPNTEKVEGMAKKLGIPMTPELMQLGNNEAISNALVEIAVGMGKTEAEISASLD